MVRVEYSAATSADPELTWKLFTNIFLWRRFADVYGDIEWRSGEPWVVGSRLKIEIVRPLKTTVDHVITVSSRPKCIAWIDHAMGNTMEQWVQFEATEDGGTRVHTWAELTGTTGTVGERPVAEVLKDFIGGWYDRFCEECDLAAQQELQMM
jgi:hypothetical protein